MSDHPIFSDGLITPFIDAARRDERQDDHDRLVEIQRHNYDALGMWKTPKGVWCKWADVEAEVTRLTQAHERLKAHRDHIGEAMWLALDLVREHVGEFDTWPEALKHAFTDAIIDTSPLTPDEIAWGHELAAKFGWKQDDAAEGESRP